jgi:hypothetical protein
MKRLAAVAVIAVIALLAARPRPAHATFHLWEITEVYSNANGTVQYIELSTTSASQDETMGVSFTANSDGTIRSVTLDHDLGSNSTANTTFLIATGNLAALPGGIAPDFVVPCNVPFFDPDATTITLTLVGADSLTFSGTQLPTDGEMALYANAAGTLLPPAANTPQNFAGTDGDLNLTGCVLAGTCTTCDDGLFCNGAETCSAACSPVAGTAPCDPDLCTEATDTCAECNDNGDCNDGNVCTTDTCNGSMECDHVNNTVACDDGLFCNGGDTCSGGACTHAGDPCAPQGCLEGSDSCGDCDDPADCDDGLFCTGVEECTGGACSSPGDPCSPPEVCAEDGDQCVDTTPDAGVPDAAAPDAAPEPPDAAPAPDAGEGGGGGGCCRTGGRGEAGSLALGLLVVAALRLRRNRNRR